jgi:hypothetical protein
VTGQVIGRFSCLAEGTAGLRWAAGAGGGGWPSAGATGRSARVGSSNRDGSPTAASSARAGGSSSQPGAGSSAQPGAGLGASGALIGSSNGCPQVGQNEAFSSTSVPQLGQKRAMAA